MKRKIKQILAALLVMVMLVGVMPITGFAASETPTFSISKLSETSDEVKISFNLESGSFTSLDWQIASTMQHNVNYVVKNR